MVYLLDEALSRSPIVRAATYSRMSTDHQDHSIRHQQDAISTYAIQSGYEVVRSYVDEGRSGLRVNDRIGLQQLLTDVQSGLADFSVVLIYDVSRWGRFQDVDESAYYEYLCRRAGIQIIYCAEQFLNDGSSISSILKGIKRVMAAEYSRELSVKVFAAQCKFIEMGYKQGGTAVYGLRRVTVSPEGKFGRTLLRGDRKGRLTDRVTYRLGPKREVETVRRIYKMYLDESLGEAAIVRILNSERIPWIEDRQWNAYAVRCVLTNERYIGDLVFNKKSYKLHKVISYNSSATWIRNETAFPSLISRKDFEKAQFERQSRLRPRTDNELLNMLRKISSEHGKVTGDLIDSLADFPTHKTYLSRFGSMSKAYAMAGLTPASKVSKFVVSKCLMLDIRKSLVEDVVKMIYRTKASVNPGPQNNMLMLNACIALRIATTRCRPPVNDRIRWRVTTQGAFPADFLLVARLNHANTKVVDFYLFPMMTFSDRYITIREERPEELEKYRHDTLESVFGVPPESVLFKI